MQTLLTTTAFFLCGSFTTLAANTFDGQLDSVSDNIITGWAKNETSIDTPVKVTVSIILEGSQEPVLENTLFANEYRDSGEYSPHTAGYCGFSWEVDWSTLENGTYQIKMKAGTRNIYKTKTYQNTSGKTTADMADAADSADNTTNTAIAGTGNYLLGVFKTTAYCPCYTCSEGWGRSTSTGATARAFHTVAVDPRVIPYGSKLLIDGIIYTAEDRGGAVKGNHIDIFYNTHAETRSHGVVYKDVYLVY